MPVCCNRLRRALYCATGLRTGCGDQRRRRGRLDGIDPDLGAAANASVDVCWMPGAWIRRDACRIVGVRIPTAPRMGCAAGTSCGGTTQACESRRLAVPGPGLRRDFGTGRPVSFGRLFGSELCRLLHDRPAPGGGDLHGRLESGRDPVPLLQFDAERFNGPADRSAVSLVLGDECCWRKRAWWADPGHRLAAQGLGRSGGRCRGTRTAGRARCGRHPWLHWKRVQLFSARKRPLS